MLVRVRSNRVFFHPPQAAERPLRGHPRRYGERFAPDDPATGSPPDGEETWTVTDRQGRTRLYHLQAWREMRMRGEPDRPMHRCLFPLIRVRVTPPEGEMVYPRPLWLAPFGPRRNEWPLQAVVAAYLRRSDREQGHRFLERNLPANSYQTPEVRNEEHQWSILLLSYFWLWLARDVARVVL